MFTEPQVRGLKRKISAETPTSDSERLRKHLSTGRVSGPKTGQPSATSQSSATSTTPSSPPCLSANHSGNHGNLLTPSSQPTLAFLQQHGYHQKRLQDSHLSYARLRQIIFNISMGKLSRYRQTPDPSLLRSVLICNTLKRLEKDLEREGVKINFGPSGVSFIPPVMTLDPPPPPSTLTSGATLPSLASEVPDSLCPATSDKSDDEENTAPDSDKYLMDLDTVSSGRVTPFQKTDTSLDNCYNPSTTDVPVSSPSWNVDDSTERLSSLNWSSVLTFTSGSAPDANIRPETVPRATTRLPGGGSEPMDIEPKTATSLHTLMPPTTTASLLNSPSEASSPSSSLVSHLKGHRIAFHGASTGTPGSPSHTYSSGSNDEIFGDIDLSLYDFDLLSPLSPPSSVKLAPVSAEELMRTIAAESDDETSSSSSSSTTSTSSSSSASSSGSPCSAPVKNVATSLASTPSSPSVSCGTTASSPVFQKRYFTSKEGGLFLDDIPAIS